MSIKFRFIGLLALAATALAENADWVGWTTSAGPAPTTESRGIAPMTAVGPFGPVQIVVTPVGTPHLWHDAVLAAITDVRNGGLVRRVDATSPSDYTTFPDFRVTWVNLVYSQTNFMWKGELNPKGVFSTQTGGPIVSFMIDASTTDRTDQSDTMSLDRLVLNAVSTDGDNLLGTKGKPVTFDGRTYSDTAIGIRSDGSLITTGPSSQLCRRVLVFAFSPLMNCGDTQEGLDLARNWVNQVGNDFNIDVTVNDLLTGVSGRTAVTIGNLPMVRMSIQRKSGVLTIGLVGDDSHVYTLLSGDSVSTITNETGVVGDQGTRFLINPDKPAEFFRIRVQ